MKDTIEVKVIRAGQEVLIENHDIVVGDLLVLDTGDKIVADGVAVESFGLVVDEASLTGESEPLAKNPKEDPWCRSGTQVGFADTTARHKTQLIVIFLLHLHPAFKTSGAVTSSQ